MESGSLLALAAFLGANFAAASTGGIFRPGAWYERLSKPSWTPPDWAFPVVWSALYVASAVAAWRVTGALGWGAAAGFLTLYAVQLILNAGWSVIFFGFRRMDLAMAEVAFLWLSVAGLIALAAPVDALAAALFAPYLLWVTIAAALNFTVWRRNPNANA